VSRTQASPPRRPRFDYTAVGHVTVDVLADGSRRPGGGKFYSGLQAARLGLRTLLITRGVPAEIDALVGEFARELTLRVLPAARTTTLQSEGHRQRLLAWAGPIGVPRGLDTEILHIAPIARETAPHWEGEARYVGLTAQGLVRSWRHDGELLEQSMLEREQLPRGCDAVVVSEHERDSVTVLEREHAGLVAITRGAGSATIVAPGRSAFDVPALATNAVRDDVGAGDVFAAALFIALARGETARDAVVRAHAAAALRIAGEGPGAIGDAAAIDARLRARA
jgi:hypothetical protein